jgi:uncharacterized membrane protein
MHILYLGDNAGTSAEYLKDVLQELEHSVTHVDSASDVSLDETKYDCIIVSDYPAKKLDNESTEKIKNMIENGARLIMLGGWDSFNGRGTNYANHALSELLPVNLQTEDDRVNAPQGLVLWPDETLHELDPPLDWTNPPIICGYNSVEAKAGAEHLVWAKPVQTDGTDITLLQAHPLVVKGLFGIGSVLACMTDVAPHWCGGLVDWGSERRVFAHVEVGDMYINFIHLLLEVE